MNSLIGAFGEKPFLLRTYRPLRERLSRRTLAVALGLTESLRVLPMVGEFKKDTDDVSCKENWFKLKTLWSALRPVLLVWVALWLAPLLLALCSVVMIAAFVLAPFVWPFWVCVVMVRRVYWWCTFWSEIEVDMDNRPMCLWVEFPEDRDEAGDVFMGLYDVERIKKGATGFKS